MGIQIQFEADASFHGGSLEADAGYSVAGVGDTNGDGLTDILIGGVGISSPGPGAGEAYVVFGPMVGEMDLGVEADGILHGCCEADLAGAAVASAGDPDGDGLMDIIIGAPGYEAGMAAARAYLVSGPVSGEMDLSEADAILVGVGDDHAGESVAGVGDTDGDGCDDFLVGAMASLVEDEPRGAAFLFTRGVSGALSLHDADATIEGAGAVYGVGERVAGAGDVDADGLADVLVSASERLETHDLGLIALIRGPVDGTTSILEADMLLSASLPDDRAGSAIAGAGDVDADGRDDILIGAPRHYALGHDRGRVYLIHGSDDSGESSLMTANVVFVGETDNSFAGSAVAGAGDVNGDGFADCLVGAPLDSSGAPWGGAVYLLQGPFVLGEHDLADADVKFVGMVTDAGAGYSVAGVGDTNGDGLDDILIGAPGGVVEGGQSAGDAFLFLGGLQL